MESECSSGSPFRFFVPMLRAHSGYLDWIQVNRVGVEIQDLLQPGAFEAGRVDDLERFWEKNLQDSSVEVSVHGPLVADFLQDPRRTDEGMGHLIRGMDFAQRIGARFFIVHPLLGRCLTAGIFRAPRDAFEAWKEAHQAAGCRGLVLLLENSNEEIPDHVLELSRFLGDGSASGLCLDLGHAHRHSERDLGQWLAAFADRLSYVHLYNATRDGDQHRALGDGELDITAFLKDLASAREGVALCLEMDVPQILASVPWLTSRGLFTLHPIQADLF